MKIQLTMFDYGLKIKEIMRQRKISQVEMSRRLGMSEVRLHQVLNAKGHIRIDKFFSILEILKLPLYVEEIQNVCESF